MSMAPTYQVIPVKRCIHTTDVDIRKSSIYFEDANLFPAVLLKDQLRGVHLVTACRETVLGYSRLVGRFRQRWQQVIFCKSKSSHKSFPCKSKSSHN